MSKNTPPTGEVSLSRRKLFGLKRRDSEPAIESTPRKIAVINPLTCLAYHKIVCYTCTSSSAASDVYKRQVIGKAGEGVYHCDFSWHRFYSGLRILALETKKSAP